MENSNLKFTETKTCQEEYEIYFKNIDNDNKGAEDGYKELFVKR